VAPDVVIAANVAARSPDPRERRRAAGPTAAGRRPERSPAARAHVLPAAWSPRASPGGRL